MSLSELQVWIMRQLATQNGVIEGLPSRTAGDSEAVEQAIDGLIRRQYVTVVGPPNGNSYLGQDVDELRLRQYGVDYIRTLR